MQQVVPQASMKLPTLNLDHDVVLSAWEQIGGDIFLGSEFELQPACFDIDLSTIEASLKQSSSASLEQFSNITPVPNLFPAIPDFSFPTLSFGLPEIIHPHSDIKPHDKAPQWSQPFLPTSCSVPAPAPKSIPMHIKLEPEPHGSSSSLSSNSADIAIVPEVTSHPAVQVHPSHQTSAMHSVPQSYVPTMMSQVAAPQMPPSKPMDTEVWRTRKECLERYKEKKARRMYTKKIRYQLRKINADKRPRIKGRFVKKEELDEYMKSLPIGSSNVLPTQAGEEDCSDNDEDEDTISSDKE